MHLNGVDFFFWAASFLGHLVLAVVLWTRHRVKEFPFFTALIANNIVRTVVLYLVFRYGTQASYFYTYWSLALLDVAVQLCIIYEIAGAVFRPVGVWARDVRSSVVWLVGGSIALAAGVTSLASPPTRMWLQTVMIKGNFFSAALISELFVCMVALSVTVGLPWKTHVAAVAQGLGVYSVIDILVETAHSYLGVARDTQTYVALSHVRIAVYLVCLTYWIVMLWRDAPQALRIPEEMRTQLFALQGKMECGLRSLRSGRKW
jgi:hypothetical protein